MSFRMPVFAFLALLAGCGPKPPEVVHVGNAHLRFPRHDFYRSITDEGASRPTFVAYVTPEKDRRQSIGLEYDDRETSANGPMLSGRDYLTSSEETSDPDLLPTPS